MTPDEEVVLAAKLAARFTDMTPRSAVKRAYQIIEEAAKQQSELEAERRAAKRP